MIILITNIPNLMDLSNKINVIARIKNLLQKKNWIYGLIKKMNIKESEKNENIEFNKRKVRV